MKYVVHYETEINIEKLNSTIYQSQPLDRGSRLFLNIDEAREFAKTVKAPKIYNSIGKRVSL